MSFYGACLVNVCSHGARAQTVATCNMLRCFEAVETTRRISHWRRSNRTSVVFLLQADHERSSALACAAQTSRQKCVKLRRPGWLCRIFWFDFQVPHTRNEVSHVTGGTRGGFRYRVISPSPRGSRALSFDYGVNAPSSSSNFFAIPFPSSKAPAKAMYVDIYEVKKTILVV